MALATHESPWEAESSSTRDWPNSLQEQAPTDPIPAARNALADISPDLPPNQNTKPTTINSWGTNTQNINPSGHLKPPSPIGDELLKALLMLTAAGRSERKG